MTMVSAKTIIAKRAKMPACFSFSILSMTIKGDIIKAETGLRKYLLLYQASPFTI